MKRMKTTVSFLLALVMVLCLGVTAFATEIPGTADPGNTITVTNAQKGETYKIYKMLDLTVDEGKINYAYTVNENWDGFFDGGEGAAYVNIDAAGNVTWKEAKKTAEDMIAFGKAAAAFAEDAVSPVPTAKPDITPDTGKDITFTNLEPGYYLITSTNGTRAMVDTTPANTNPSIREKNYNPTISKRVHESSNHYYKVNDAQIGQTVDYRTVVQAKRGAKNYVVHDAMDAGLSFESSSVKIMVGDTELKAKTLEGETATPYTAENQAGYQYEVKTSGLDNDCDFHIVFVQAYLDTITVDTEITITYAAKLNDQAVIGGSGNNNKTWLTWGNQSKTEVAWTITYTWKADVLKYGNGDEGILLADAQFVLLNQAKDKVAKFNSEGKITEWVALPTAGADGKIALDSWPEGAVQTTKADGKISVQGLDSSILYYLREVKSPAGYNLLNEDKSFQIEATRDDTANTMSQIALTVRVNNQAGTELPETGGIGTTIFYVVGSILLVGAAVLLITKRRMQAE